MSAWIGSKNLGDELIFKVLLEQLEVLGISRKDVVAITLDPNRTRKTFGTQSVGHRDILGQLIAIRQGDVLVFGGGGLLQDETSIWNLPYHLSRVWIARLMGKEVVGLGLGAGLVSMRFSKWLIRMTFGTSVPMNVRDTESLQILKQISVQNVKQAADLVFGHSVQEYESDGYIAVALRPFSKKRSWLPVHMREHVTLDDPSHIADALDVIARQVNLPIRLVSFDLDKDLDYHHTIAAQMSTKVSFVSPTLKDVTKVIGAANVVIGMRYHAAVLAFLCGVPSVLIGYSPKVQSLAKEAPRGCKVVENNIKGIKALPKLVNEVLDEKQSVIIARERLRDSSLENYKPLCGLLRANNKLR
ncbi:polysaccharide pyruvyl transferase family protein [Vibrio sp. Isolate33]|uniref:polysaccharide pyruvyl transferase family protein n=1 Tax=Vibrio sp. Isolate33 TaxID=2908539 RepID=UPI001EFD4919|nr:polysaccharide pyruvyl transferase family protein [Vibrio sp. Isolate33]